MDEKSRTMNQWVAGDFPNAKGPPGSLRTGLKEGATMQDDQMDPALYECLGNGTGRGGKPTIRRADDGTPEMVLADGTIAYRGVLIWDDDSRAYYRLITTRSDLVPPATP